MRVANTEVAGLAGGLYESFENLGLRFFSGLIGAVRAERRELEYKRVTAGAALAGVIWGFVLGFIATCIAALGGSPDVGCAIIMTLILGPSIGGLLFRALASIIVNYIRRLRVEDVRSASAPTSGASFETVFAEAHKRYLDSGYPPKDAYREAWWFAALSTGVYKPV